MKTIPKSLLYFALTIVIGNILLAAARFMQHSNQTFEIYAPSAAEFFGLILLTTVFCLPLLIPILVFFTLMKTYKPYFPLNMLLAAAFGLVVSLGWMLVLNFMADWLEKYYIWVPFVMAATISGVLTELVSWLFQKPTKLARSNKNTPTLSPQST